ncbi:hypothetical protein H8E88_26165 [candidate division KSB1 bacterium]|nr:hypothetical protein [candidate division KSB1 bacterium]
MTKNDPTISQIRETRHQISERFNHDPKKIVEYYIELQKKYSHRFLDESKKFTEASFVGSR